MSKDFHFQARRKVFTYKRVKYILSIYNKLHPDNQVNIDNVLQRNSHTLSDLLNRIGFKGELISEHIIKHFYENINKQIDKKADDELFNKLFEIKKEEQRFQQKKQEYD